MSVYDNYSSDEDEVFPEQQKSNVLLGLVDVPVADELANDEEPMIEDTFIGGKPVWLKEDSIPDKKMLTCGNCGSPMALLLQAYSPLDGKLYDRVIYIFACKKTNQCSKKKGSVRCIRGISKNPERVSQIKAEQEEEMKKDLDRKLNIENKKKKQIEMTKDLFSNNDSGKGSSGTSANPFDSNANPFASSSPFSAQKPVSKGIVSSEVPKKPTLADTLRKEPADTKTTKKKEQSVKPVDLPAYPGYFLYVEPEKMKKSNLDPELEKYKHLIDKDIDSESIHSGKDDVGSSKMAQSAQNANIANMLSDKHFEAFTNTVKHNPLQVLRYDIGGRPLLYSGKDNVSTIFPSSGDILVPRPAYNPSSFRRFELQLMPKAIMDLESSPEDNLSFNDILNGMSWGTIIVCTDAEDYVPDSSFDHNKVAYIEEWCGVQWEESV